MPSEPQLSGPTPPDSAPSSHTLAPLHVLWRPGVGMAVWIDGEPADLPEPLRDAVSGRRFRSEIPIVDDGNRRRFVRAATLGLTSAVSLLDASRSVTVPGDVRWYRYLLDGVRAFVTAGAVAPSAEQVAGEWLLRWVAIPTPTWRSWHAVVLSSAPDALLHNGSHAALDDFLAELVDHECRTTIVRSIPRLGEPRPASPVVRALLPGTDVGPPCSPERLSAAAGSWSRWDAGVPRDDQSLIFRLHEPEYDDLADSHWDDAWDDETFDLPTRDEVADASRWRLEVCRRSIDGQIEPVAPHRLDAHELDELTTALAAAVREFPELDRADPDRGSLDFLLPTDVAAELFATGAAALGAAGIPVLLPRTIAEVRPSLTLRALAPPGGGAPAAMVGLREIREFEWRLALGDSPDAITLTDADLDDLSGQKGDLVRVRGVWVRAEGSALTRAAAFVATQRALAASAPPADFGELFGLVTGESDRLPVPVTRVEGLSWLDDVAEGGAIRPEPVTPPADLEAILRPYQQRGLDWLAHLSNLGVGGVLADDMGLGKTLQVIALECHERSVVADDAETPGPTLVVCPMSLVGNWSREFARFAPTLRVAIHHGPSRAAGATFTAIRDSVDVVITTFAIAGRDLELLSAHPWHRIVVDEAQHLKNVNTIAAKAIRTIPADRRLALTGTPVENRLEDLRAVIDLVNPGLLGSASVFRARYAEPIERDRDPGALRRLSAITRPFILRREKTDPAIAADLPEKAEFAVRANLTVEQAALYRAVIDELMAALRDKQQRTLRRRNVLAALTRLKQVCNHPAHYLADGTDLVRDGEHRSGKVELLADIVSTVADEGDRALVFTQFAAFGEMLSGWLGEQFGTEIPLLHGGLGRTERDRLVADFQSDDGPPVMLATLKAGGTGLNLTAANHVIHVDRWWNPAVEDQATDRAYRIGQNQKVSVHRFVCVGTIEERIDDMIAKKRELSRLTVAAGENWVSDLADDELFELFRLRDEAVSE
ncbi:ATP-dependent helicase [Gordonia amicalis]|nr:DEAD/DEAH box helicase [Gordonia amicalis]NKX77916.1 ATP-dependent helicase [Gordonia amicalis]GAC52984.1 putative helicase [Gordonia amicalis NBRC 100051 = JCM 11271]